MITDFFGQELEVGDIVACLKTGTSSSWLTHGIILKRLNKTCMVYVDENITLIDDPIFEITNSFMKSFAACNYDLEYMINMHSSRKDNQRIVKNPNNETVINLIRANMK